MKKILLGLSFVFAVTSLSAKKVKFAVDMTGQVINVTGIHVIGDFQALAGLGADLDPATATMVQEGTTNIYSIIVDIPAFRKYEYKFVNGDLSYEVEVVPDAAQVGYNFDDNRWLYVDSLRNDTTFVGALLFSGSAPAGLNLIRYKVDMNNTSATPATGVHVGSGNNFFSPSEVRMYSFGDSIYEIINYFSIATTNYRFFNGNTVGTAENIIGNCSVFGNREVTSTNRDTVLPVVCFAYCSDCSSVSVKEIKAIDASFKSYPNPAKDVLTIESTQNNLIESVTMYNVAEQEVKHNSNIRQAKYTFATTDLTAGIYTVKIADSKNQIQHLKIIIE